MCQRDTSCNVRIGGRETYIIQWYVQTTHTHTPYSYFIGFPLCHRRSSRQEFSNGDLTVIYTALCWTVRGQSRRCEVRQVFAGLWAVGGLQFFFFVQQPKCCVRFAECCTSKPQPCASVGYEYIWRSCLKMSRGWLVSFKLPAALPLKTEPLPIE